MRLGVEIESREDALQRHLAKYNLAETRIIEATRVIGTGNFSQEAFRELSVAYDERSAVVLDGVPRERALVIGSRRFLLPPVASH